MYDFELFTKKVQSLEINMKKLMQLIKNESGATAIEYGLIAALIAVAAITAMQGLGNELQTTFNTTSSAMQTANSSAS